MIVGSCVTLEKPRVHPDLGSVSQGILWVVVHDCPDRPGLLPLCVLRPGGDLPRAPGQQSVQISPCWFPFGPFTFPLGEGLEMVPVKGKFRRSSYYRSSTSTLSYFFLRHLGYGTQSGQASLRLGTTPRAWVAGILAAAHLQVLLQFKT